MLGTPLLQPGPCTLTTASPCAWHTLTAARPMHPHTARPMHPGPCTLTTVRSRLLWVFTTQPMLLHRSSYRSGVLWGLHHSGYRKWCILYLLVCGQVDVNCCVLLFVPYGPWLPDEGCKNLLVIKPTARPMHHYYSQAHAPPLQPGPCTPTTARPTHPHYSQAHAPPHSQAHASPLQPGPCTLTAQ